MNKGDKLVCIKTYVHGITEYYTEGEVYEVMRVSIANEVYIQTNVSNTKRVNGMWFSQRDIYRTKISIKMFVDYFIPLAELRELQIKSVLDD